MQKYFQADDLKNKAKASQPAKRKPVVFTGRKQTKTALKEDIMLSLHR